MRNPFKKPFKKIERPEIDFDFFNWDNGTIYYAFEDCYPVVELYDAVFFQFENDEIDILIRPVIMWSNIAYLDENGYETGTYEVVSLVSNGPNIKISKFLQNFICHIPRGQSTLFIKKWLKEHLDKLKEIQDAHKTKPILSKVVKLKGKEK